MADRTQPEATPPAVPDEDIEDCAHCGAPVRYDEDRGVYVHLSTDHPPCWLNSDPEG